jgi:RimJ/RimL family protein N-acetyltransferase
VVTDSLRPNQFGQPVGPDLGDWRPPPFPDVDILVGHWSRVERLRAAHAEQLYAGIAGVANAPLWTYSSDGPLPDPGSFREFVRRRAEEPDRVPVAIVDGEGVACGLAHYLAIRPQHGVVEVGGIVLGPRLQRTTAATEAMVLLARHVFALGYRRYEWKCDALNEPSRRAARRLGFRYEGRFRNAVTVKGRSRDTDWFAITDDDWPRLAPAYEKWLDPANFVDGVQQSRLNLR